MKAYNKIINLIDDFTGIFYPRLCVACNENLHRHEDYICLNCLYALPKTNFHLTEDNPVNKLFWGRIKINNATSFLHFDKGGKVQSLIHQLKYKGVKEIGYDLGNYFGSYLVESDNYSSVDIIVPVPLHIDKLKARGYNQSNWIAKGLSHSMKKPLDNTNLLRVKFTETQTKKTRIERWENVKSVFGIYKPSLFKNKHILLVDDVVTTGSTLEACSQKILEIENTKVSIATLAKA